MSISYPIFAANSWKFFLIKAQLFVYMIHTSRVAKRLYFSFIFTVSLLFVNQVMAQNGQALFSSNCASCHAIKKDLTGPALAGVEERWGGR
jgi:cytochrome c2